MTVRDAKDYRYATTAFAIHREGESTGWIAEEISARVVAGDTPESIQEKFKNRYNCEVKVKVHPLRAMDSKST